MRLLRGRVVGQRSRSADGKAAYQEGDRKGLPFVHKVSFLRRGDLQFRRGSVRFYVNFFLSIEGYPGIARVLFYALPPFGGRYVGINYCQLEAGVPQGL